MEKQIQSKGTSRADEITSSIGRIRRRSILKAIGGATSAGSLGFSSIVGAKESGERLVFKIEEISLSEQTAVEAAYSRFARTLYSVIENGNPDPEDIVSFSDGNRRNITANDNLIASSVEFETELGKVGIGFDKEKPINGFYDLNRSALTEGQRKRIAGHIGWPAGTSGTVVVDETAELTFSRSVTETELEELKEVVPEEGDPSAVDARSTPHTESGSGRDKGRYNVRYEGSVYVVNANQDDIITEEPLNAPSIQRSCESAAAGCVADLILAFPACRWTARGCFFGPLACIVLLLSLCTPNVLLVGLSRNCEYAVDQCL